jgi:hypothetical protein
VETLSNKYTNQGDTEVEKPELKPGVHPDLTCFFFLRGSQEICGDERKIKSGYKHYVNEKREENKHLQPVSKEGQPYIKSSFFVVLLKL